MPTKLSHPSNMNPNYTDITVILDKSGSMAGIAKDTIIGFNAFLREQQEAKGIATLSLWQFNDKSSLHINARDIKKVDPLSYASYTPVGGTALLDTMANAIETTGIRIGSMPEEIRPAKVVVLIITDGEENCSRYSTYSKIQQLVLHQREIYKWEFVFMGANIDSFKIGEAIGVFAANTINYANNSAGTSELFKAMGANTSAFRSGSKISMDFEPAQYAAQMSAGSTANPQFPPPPASTTTP